MLDQAPGRDLPDKQRALYEVAAELGRFTYESLGRACGQSPEAIRKMITRMPPGLISEAGRGMFVAVKAATGLADDFAA